MMQIVLIGVAAGAASALLFASFASGSLISVPLFYLSPLPIMIAALGWSHLAALVAAVVAGAVLAGIFGWMFLLAFLAGVGLPAWWLGYLALLARPGAEPGALEWYPVGRLITWVAGLAAAIVMLVLLTVATDAETLRTTLRSVFAAFFQPGVPAPTVLVEYPHLVLPPTAGVLTILVWVFVLWLAGRVVRTSGRLKRPWPDIAAFTFPPAMMPVFIAALVGMAVLSGMAAIGATVLTATLTTAYGLLGLAVVHSVTRAVSGRGLILGAVYGAVVVFGWPLLVMAVLGMAEPFIDLRGRTAGRAPPNAPQE